MWIIFCILQTISIFWPKKCFLYFFRFYFSINWNWIVIEKHALKLMKSYPSKNQYYFFVAVSLVQMIPTSELKPKNMNLVMAEKMLEKVELSFKYTLLPGSYLFHSPFPPQSFSIFSVIVWSKLLLLHFSCLNLETRTASFQ